MNGRQHVAFVAGATGYVGRNVVAALCSRGIDTYAHVRHDSPRLEEWRARFNQLGASVTSAGWDVVDMQAELRRIQPSLVFALLGTTSARAGREGFTAREQYERVDFGLTAILLEASESVGNVQRFVYLSAAGVAPDTRNPYLAVRARIERLLCDSDLPWTTVRPSFITGPDRGERRPTERIAAAIADVILATAGAFGAHDLRNRWRSISGEKLAKALVRVALDPAFVNAAVHGDVLNQVV